MAVSDTHTIDACHELGRKVTLMYRVDICRPGDELTSAMGRMREWLDRRRIEPSAFRHEFVDGIAAFRVTFSVASEATAFAEMFGGQIGPTDDTRAA